MLNFPVVSLELLDSKNRKLSMRAMKKTPPVSQSLCIGICALFLFLLSTAKLPAQAVAVHEPTPMARLQSDWWAERHQAVLERVKACPEAQLLLLGDSITNNYEKNHLPDENFQPTWNQFYAPRKAINLGFSGDTTSNVLWRIDHGELEGLHPKVVILLIGTNDTSIGHETAEETEAGIHAVVADLEQKLSTTHILLLGILPSNISPEKTAVDQAVNLYLSSHYAKNQRVTFLDIGAIFYRNGVLDTQLFYDPRLPQPRPALHPDTKGQRRMAEAIEPTLVALMGEIPKTM
ncbi:GDSL-type esterase/lipase family protein [Telmatobacter bradus]|uniref:GDSL-type esterase/lipase family protein n=1 Tax=Telmatobacter bradus TaxID=474953 RepID=UPI003B42D259